MKTVLKHLEAALEDIERAIIRLEAISPDPPPKEPLLAAADDSVR